MLKVYGVRSTISKKGFRIMQFPLAKVHNIGGKFRGKFRASSHHALKQYRRKLHEEKRLASTLSRLNQFKI